MAGDGSISGTAAITSAASRKTESFHSFFLDLSFKRPMFNSFNCTTAGKQLIFTAGTTQTIGATLSLTGSSGNEIVLRSSSPGNTWTINNGSTYAVDYVDVEDSIASAANLLGASGSIDTGNNSNWVFFRFG